MRPLLLLTFLLLAPLNSASAAGCSAPDWTAGVAEDGRLALHAPGVLRPDEGTIELTVRFSKPSTEFGNGWEFLFSSDCGLSVGPGGSTLFGAYFPPEPEKGLALVLRSSRGASYLRHPGFTCSRGERMNLAFSWGRELRLYVNGTLRAKAPWRGPLETRLYSPFLHIDRFGPFNASQLRISTRERTAGELNPDPEASFAADDDTACLADADLTRVSMRTTRWHRASSHACLMPVLRSGAQCLVEGEPVSLPLLAVNHGETPVTRRVRCVARGGDGRALLDREVTFTLPADGRHRVLSLPLPELVAAGHYPLEVSVAGGTEPLSYPLALALFGRAERTVRAGTLADCYGQHLTAGWDEGVWERLGVRASRAWAGGAVFLWWKVEPAPGEFDFRKSDAYVEQCRRAGMEVLGVLGYPPRWAAVEPGAATRSSNPLALRPERWSIRNLGDWRRYVRATVERYRGRVRHWEIYNEVNFHPPSPAATFAGTTADYLELLRAAHEEAKRADPGAQIVLSGFSPDADRNMPAELLALGAAEHCDIFATHAYTGAFRGVDEAWLKAYRGLRPGGVHWQTEQMWHLLPDDGVRAFKTVEILVDYLANGCARFFNMGDSGVFFDRNTQSPKIDVCAVAGILRQLRVCDAHEAVLSFPGDRAFSLRHVFRRTDGRRLLVLGSLGARHEVALTGGVTGAVDLLQRPLPLRRSVDGTVTLPQDTIVYALCESMPAVASATAQATERPVLRNPGFENLSGDDAAGLARCSPLDWQMRERTYDQGGRISLTERARTGRAAVRLQASGSGRVYVFQDLSVRAPGTYRLTAHFRRETDRDTAAPLLFVFDRTGGRTHGGARTSPVIGSARYERCELVVTLPATDGTPLAVGCGIASGAGALLLDDVAFDPAPPAGAGAAGSAATPSARPQPQAPGRSTEATPAHSQ